MHPYNHALCSLLGDTGTRWFNVDIVRHIFMEFRACILAKKDECWYMGCHTALDKLKSLRCIHLSSQTIAVGCHPLPALAR